MLYDYPHYYEVAFSFRDIAREAAILDDALGRHSRIAARSCLELGCGHAPHAGELSRRGITYTGLDINHQMLEYAQSRWRGISPPPRFLHGDMTAFRLDQPVDFAFVMLGSLYAETPGELDAHFNSVAASLRPGGLYFLDACIQFGDPLSFDNTAYVIERDGITIESRFAIRLIDPDTDLYEESWTVDVNDHGVPLQFHTVERNRAISPKKFLGLIQSRRDFELVGWYKDWDLDAPLTVDSVADRPLTILRRLQE